MSMSRLFSVILLLAGLVYGIAGCEGIDPADLAEQALSDEGEASIEGEASETPCPCGEDCPRADAEGNCGCGGHGDGEGCPHANAEGNCGCGGHGDGEGCPHANAGGDCGHGDGPR